MEQKDHRREPMIEGTDDSSCSCRDGGSGHGPRKLGADARRAGQGRGQRSFSQFRGVRHETRCRCSARTPSIIGRRWFKAKARGCRRARAPAFRERNAPASGPASQPTDERGLTPVINASEINEMLKRTVSLHDARTRTYVHEHVCVYIQGVFIIEQK